MTEYVSIRVRIDQRQTLRVIAATATVKTGKKTTLENALDSLIELWDQK